MSSLIPTYSYHEVLVLSAEGLRRRKFVCSGHCHTGHWKVAQLTSAVRVAPIAREDEDFYTEVFPVEKKKDKNNLLGNQNQNVFY